MKYINRIHTTHIFYTISAEESRDPSKKVFFWGTREGGFPDSLRTFPCAARRWNYTTFLILPPIFVCNIPLLLSVCLPSERLGSCLLLPFYDVLMVFYLLEIISFHCCLSTAAEVISSASASPPTLVWLNFYGGCNIKVCLPFQGRSFYPSLWYGGIFSANATAEYEKFSFAPRKPLTFIWVNFYGRCNIKPQNLFCPFRAENAAERYPFT